MTQTADPRRWWTLVVLCVSLLVLGLDATVLNVALPTLVKDLGASTAQLQWIVDAYTLVFAGLLLTGGSLGDRFGRKRALSIGLVVFASASAAGAFATSALVLSISRGVMGIGGALMMPATLSIIANVFTDPRERSKAVGAWAGISGAGVALGPVVGGFLLEHFWWGSVFLINVPVAIVSLLLGRRLVPESKDPSAAPTDLLGSVTSMAGLSLLLWAIIEVPTKGWTSAEVIVPGIGGLAVLAAFVLWELHNDEPMLDMQFFRNPRFSVASASITMAFFAMSGTMFLLTQLLQFVLGYSPLSAGYRVIPMSLTMSVVAPWVPRLIERFGSKRMVSTGLSIAACGLLVLTTVNETTSYWRVFLGLVVLSIGISTGMVPATDSIMGSLPKEKAGVGSAVNDTTRQVGGALGVAVLGSLLAAGYRSKVAVGTLKGALASKARSSVGGALEVSRQVGDRALAASGRAAYVHGMHVSLLLGAAFIFGGALVSLVYLPARAPDHHLAHGHVHGHAGGEAAADQGGLTVGGEELAGAFE